MVISIINEKGGVGKTVTAVNLSAALAETERRVLLVDLDAQHNATTMCGVQKPVLSAFDALVDPAACPLPSVIVHTSIKSLDVVPGHRALAGLESALRDVIGREMLLAEALEPVRERYDTIVIDNGPTLGIGPAMSLCAADIALIPLQCEPLALVGLSQVQETINTARRRINPKLRTHILLTMLDTRTRHGREIAEGARARFGEAVFRTPIKRFAKLADTMQNGTVLQYAAHSPAAAAYRALANEIQEHYAQQKA